MIKKSKILITILALTVLLGSCGKETIVSDETETQGDSPLVSQNEVEQTEQPETEKSDERIMPNIPESADFAGEEIRFMHWALFEGTVYYNRDIYSDGLTGEAINDTVFTRNVKIEDSYNVKITLDMTPYANIDSAVGQAVSTGDTTYRAVYPLLCVSGGMYTKGYFHNLYDVTNLDLSKPWYDQKCVNSLSIGGILPLVSTAININDKDSTSCLLFNKQLAADTGIEDLYEITRNGKLTIDKVAEISEIATFDANGDGVMDKNDIFGYISGRDTIDNFYHGSDSLMVQKEDGKYIFTYGTEHDIDVTQKAINFMSKNFFLNRHLTDIGGDEGMRVMYRAGQGMFLEGRLAEITNFRDSDIDFGVLPIPKYDESQKEYASPVSQYTTGFMSVPITLDGDRLTVTGTVLEALAAESYYTLIPEYVESSIKIKNARDTESGEMIEIILSNRVFDPMSVYDFGGFSNAFLIFSDEGSTDIASFVQKHKTEVDTSVNTIVQELLPNK